MSYRIEDDSKKSQDIPMDISPSPAPHNIPQYDMWSASNAFDPDSDEFLQGQEIVYEAFVDDVSSPELSPETSDASSDDGREVSREEREVARRTREHYATLIAAGQNPMQASRSISPARPMQIIRSTLTVTDTPAMETERQLAPLAAPTIVRTGETIRSHAPSFDDVDPPSSDLLWSDLRALSRSPLHMPQTQSTPYVVPSPAPSVTPHIYTWERNPLYSGPPISPSPARTPRMRPQAHRRRESLPASISLMS